MDHKIFKLALLQIMVAIAGGIIYSFIADYSNFDLIVVGFTVAVALPVIYLSGFAAKKIAINKRTWIMATGMLAIIIGFAVKTATQTYIFYDFHLFPEEKNAELQDNSYLSGQDTRGRLDELLRRETGYPSYVGAFIWHLKNTTVKENNNGIITSRNIGFTESVFYWLAELGIGLLALGTGLWRQLAQNALICERCKKEKKNIFFVMGPSNLEKQIIQDAKAKNIFALKGLYAPKSSTPHDFISLKAWSCENCKDENIEVNFVVTRNGRPVEKMTRIVFSASEFAELQKIFQKN